MSDNKYDIDSLLNRVSGGAFSDTQKKRDAKRSEENDDLTLPHAKTHRVSEEKHGGSFCKQTVRDNGTVKRGYYLSVDVVRALSKRVGNDPELNASAHVEQALREYLAEELKQPGRNS